MKYLVTLFAIVFFLSPLAAFGQSPEMHQDERGLFRAKVVEILSEEVQLIPGTNVETLYQVMMVEFLEGPLSGRIVEIEDDYLTLKAGDKIFVRYVLTINGEEFFTVAEPDRRGMIYFLTFLFVGAVVWLSGWQGVRAVISLIGSFLVIFYVLLPALLAGVSPVLISSVVATIILAIAIFATHGFNRESNAALLGTVIAIVLTGFLAYFAVAVTKLTGFASDEAVFLNFNTAGSLDFSGLLLAAIIIGVIGVLDDIAITQAATVTELHLAAPKLTRRELYTKTLRIGREHVSALVNTLVFAYVGASLPLILLFYMSDQSTLMLINREIFATEIVRTIVGSIGLILTVPITTLIAVLMLYGKVKEKKVVGCSHGHHHH